MNSSCGTGDISVVIPCFNEEAGLVHLKERLRSLMDPAEQEYAVHLILVDDGSTDKTWQMMSNLFQHEPRCTLLRHSANLGVSAAIMSGICAAKTEIVCSIDSDCSYDPRELENLVPLLTPDVDLVTASPYHPAGQVSGVPSWRLFLSKAASHLYRVVLGPKLHTYTSCFRVYRRSSVLRVSLERRDFLGVTELIAKLDLQGYGIAECPAKLSARVHGVSKMKTVQVVLGHASLLCELLAIKCRRRQSIQSGLRCSPSTNGE